MKSKWKCMKFERYIFGLLLAVELIMSFTFLGYIHVPPISITTAYIPIIVAACLFTPCESTFAGLVFGLGSMYKASASYVQPADMIFSPFQSGLPVQSFILSVGTRTLFGFLIGVLFVLARKGKHQWLWKGIVALFASKLHAFLVFAAMGAFFPEYGFTGASARMFAINDIAVSMFCMVSVLLIDRFYHSEFVNRYREAVNDCENNPYWSQKISVFLGAIGFFVFCMAVFSTVYFSGRTKYMLSEHGIDVTKTVSRDILHLQIQFLAAMLALDFILLLFILLIYRYMKYREYKGEIDYLTGIMGRKLFLNHCTHVQSTNAGKKGWFLFLDVDYFKQINDTLGHSAGDDTLRQIAGNLQEIFEKYGAVGRVGGDEFAVMVEQEMTKAELEQKLTQFLESIADIWEDRKVTCSIGAYHFVFPRELKELLTETDHVLYKAKESGRACFVIEDDITK